MKVHESWTDAYPGTHRSVTLLFCRVVGNSSGLEAATSKVRQAVRTGQAAVAVTCKHSILYVGLLRQLPHIRLLQKERLRVACSFRMHVPFRSIAVACALLRTGVAVFVDDAYHVDYHLSLLGTPQEHTTFFHQPYTGSRASLLYTLSEKAQLGAVNPKDGSLVWRQSLSKSANTTSTFLRTGENQDVVISAVDGEVAAWSAADGRQAWSLNLEGAPIQDLEFLEIPEANQATAKDVVVLSGDAQPILRRVNAADGNVKWSFKDESGDVPFQVSVSTTDVFLISLHKTMLGGVKIKVVSLDPINGHKKDQYSLSSESELGSAEGILTVGANTASPIIAWTNKARTVLKVNVIGSKSISTFDIDNAETVEKITLHAPYHIDARPHFLVQYQTATHHWAAVYHVELKKQSVSNAYKLSKVAGKGTFSTSTEGANVYFTRITESEVSVVSSASHGLLARWTLSGVSDDFHPVHSVSEISVKADTVSAARSAVYLSSGDWILIRDGTLSWGRPEVLSGTISAVWAYPAAIGNLVQELKVEGHSNPVSAYIHRVTRHIADLQKLPTFLSSLPTRLIGSVYTTSAISSPALDSFGYHKTIVCATENGRVIALDAGNNGQVLWSVPVADILPGSKWQAPQLLASPDGTVLIKGADGQDIKLLNATNGQGMDLSLSKEQPAYSSSAIYTYAVENDELVGGMGPSAPVWKYVPSSGQHIASITPRPVDDPVASIGKVLGDRKVLYKYLNPNVLLVTALSESARTATISVLDSVSGSIIYTTTHEDVDVTMPLPAAISENWFVYSFTSSKALAGSKGHQLVVGEMFESPLPNDRGPGGASTNVSSLEFSSDPYVLTQTYSIPEAISLMAVSQTSQGITSRLLLAVLRESTSVIGIPRSIIDPRRPVNREPSANEAMEGLTRYIPTLEFDPKWYLTHQREVFGIQKMTTSPAVLESTSLVFAYGMDVFGTRISPSFAFDVLGKDFNKLQMLATVFALAVGTLIVAPLVRCLVVL